MEYSCPEGFKVEGPLVRTCLENGRWSGMAPKCHFYDCGLYPGIVVPKFCKILKLSPVI